MNAQSTSQTDFEIIPVNSRKLKKQFIEFPYQLYKDDPNWVPPIRSEAAHIVSEKHNPFFEHADVQLFVALKDGRVVGRISAHIDHLAQQQPAEQGFGPGSGNWGFLEAETEEICSALIKRAENWLKNKSVERVVAPISFSIWEEPGLLTLGHDHSPTILMGHHRAEYEGWITNNGYQPIKNLSTYRLKIDQEFPDLVKRIVASGERKSKLEIRRVKKSEFAAEAAIIMDILNDAWSDNWGFVPMSPSEVKHAGKELKQIVYEDLIMIAEYDSEPIAFMMTFPDINEVLKPMNGRLLPFNWIKLLRWLKKPKADTMRVPLMGVKKEYQKSRLASQTAFMMIEYIRRNSVANYGAKYAEIGWILDDNVGMVAIANTIVSYVNRTYTIYEKPI